MLTDTDYMQMALDLAGKGLGNVEPNPAVGCVIVKDNAVIGQGFHERFGGPHGEINALADCRANGHDPSGATLYVTLEPCHHHGKTPPCSRAVIEAGIKKIVIAAEDPTTQAGGGIEALHEAGLDVHVGLCRDAAEALNAPFYKHARTGRPWVILKWAQSIDGKLAWKNPPVDGTWISNEQSRAKVHALRKKVQAILTGIETVIADNPKLTVRIPGENIDRPPLRVVLDSKLRMPWDSHLITVPDAPTLVVTTHPSAQTEFQRVDRYRSAGVEVLAVPPQGDYCGLDAVLAELGRRGIQQLLVEAGPTLIGRFLAEDRADELHVFIAPLILGAGGAADLSPRLTHSAVKKLNHPRIQTLNNDIWISGRL